MIFKVRRHVRRQTLNRLDLGTVGSQKCSPFPFSVKGDRGDGTPQDTTDRADRSDDIPQGTTARDDDYPQETT